MPEHAVPFKRLGLEFIVIFLGVFGGFVADDFREYLSERRQEDALLRQLVEDLALDYADIEPIVRPSRVRGEMMTWLNNRAHGPRPPADSLTAAIDTLGQDIYFTYETSAHTYSALRSSGGLNLIRDLGLRDTIVFYYEDRVPVLEEFNEEAEQVELEWWDQLSTYVQFQPADSLVPGFPRVRVIDQTGLWADGRLSYLTMQMGGWYHSQTGIAESMLQTNRNLRLAIRRRLDSE